MIYQRRGFSLPWLCLYSAFLRGKGTFWEQERGNVRRKAGYEGVIFIECRPNVA